jgi:hypothetical protein
MKDYVLYMDTDSLFFSIEEFVCNYLKTDWMRLTDKEREEYVSKICKCVEKYVNENSFEKTQRIDFGSVEEEFKINFKQEIISKSAFFAQKKKYSLWKINDNGISVDELHTKGLDIIKSDCPAAIRNNLKETMKLILYDKTDKELKDYIENAINELYNLSVEDIASNISVNNLEKYIGKDGPGKGAGWHIKGVYNYHKLIDELGLKDKYETLGEGEKVKVVYLKENQYKIETLSFRIWPKEVEDIGIFANYDKQIEKNYILKVEDLLIPLEKQHLLDDIKLELEEKKPKKKRKRKNND